MDDGVRLRARDEGLHGLRVAEIGLHIRTHVRAAALSRAPGRDAGVAAPEDFRRDGAAEQAVGAGDEYLHSLTSAARAALTARCRAQRSVGQF